MIVKKKGRVGSLCVLCDIQVPVIFPSHFAGVNCITLHYINVGEMKRLSILVVWSAIPYYSWSLWDVILLVQQLVKLCDLKIPFAVLLFSA
jgi:hypothetical protein